MALILKQSEKDIENQILDFLKFNGIYCWKHENNAVYDTKIGKHRRSYSAHKFPGISDIIGILPCGKMLALEVKTPKRSKTATEAQKTFLDNINRLNGLAAIVTSVESVIDVFNQYANNCKNKTKGTQSKIVGISCPCR